MASTSKQTEKTSEIPPCEGTEMDLPPEWFTDGDPPPRYLQPYLLKMKNEIKKEILEDILLGHQGELPTIKPGATAKVVENQSDFQGEVIHTGIFCDNCDQLIHGIRYKCGNCPDFDLCQECESLPYIHNKNHIFLKIRYPVALKMYLKQLNQNIVTCPNPAKVYLNSRSRQSKKLYEAKFVCDETIPDSTVLPPSTKFVKSWRVVNSGTRVWTHATKLHLIQGNMAPLLQTLIMLMFHILNLVKKVLYRCSSQLHLILEFFEVIGISVTKIVLLVILFGAT
ncbi:next to BRCA1 gene 1 protein [Caerostris extrusa]|uniref:Next to BRCA1 gene 1 protein n=1 Tax=Caerostris extrusa TaxID=172846 RepID=A0AAV4VRQ0_CAEEX|nr:next to BRCA1 gene 1 protein [Caerostris extrusa]